jgi:tetratricopeptide (TPR) repeat protein
MAIPTFVEPFLSSASKAEDLVFADPRQVAQDTKPAITAGWKLLAGTVALRRHGQTSEANDWLNTLSRHEVSDQHDLLTAEMLAEAGLALSAAGEIGKAIEILNSAAGAWRDLCDRALPAQRVESSDAVAALSLQVAAFARALGIGRAAGGKGATTTARQRTALVRQWLDERAVPRRADVTATFVRALLKAGDSGAARKVCDAAIAWTAAHFTTSGAQPGAAGWRNVQPSSPRARLALYTLALAQGEVELADENFQRSVDAFAGAAELYEGQVEDDADISRLLQAKANEANSLLRLARYDAAIGIYDLVEHGFRSLGDAKRAQRVAQARLFARTKKMESGGA